MTTYEIAEAKPWYVGQILRAASECHKLAAKNAGLDHRELRSVFNQSGIKAAWLIDGKLAALGGVTGSLASTSGHIWLVFADFALKHKKALLRQARESIAELFETRSLLTTTVLDGDEPAARFAEFLGFKRRGLKRGPFTDMALKRDVEKPSETPRNYLQLNSLTPTPFIVYALPRSRTAWLSAFLSYGEWSCYHDSMMEVEGFRGMREMLTTPNTGICETGLVFAAPVLRRYFPKARIVVVRRPVADVRVSLERHGWRFAPGHLEWMAARLEEVSSWPGVLTVDFDDLRTEETCKTVFEHCLNLPFDAIWWRDWDRRNEQIDMTDRLERLYERSGETQALADELQEMMSPVSFHLETWEDFHRDGQALFREHREEVGGDPRLPFDPDFETAAAVYKLGRLQILTARVGTKMIGYLLYIIEPHPESRDVVRGVQNTFFVSAPYRGIGIEMWDVSTAELKRRGVQLLDLRSGVRSSGPKLAAFFERRGAVEDGRFFRLWIGD